MTDFLAGWKVSPVKTFRQHEFGLAVTTRTVMQIARQNQEIREWLPASEQKRIGRDAVFPRTWAAVVAAPAPQKAQEGRRRKRSTETLGTSQPSKTVNLNTTPTAMDFGEIQQTPARASALIPTIEGDLGELIARAVAAATTPLDAQLRILQTEINVKNGRRMAEGKPEAFAWLERVRSCSANGGEMSDGPVATMHSILQGLGWHWKNKIRQGLRLAEWRKAGNRRNDMRGIESMAGIDKLAASKAMNSTNICSEQCNEFRELLCGLVWTQKRQFDCQRAETPVCPFCGEEPEDEEHILCVCPRWKMLRREKQAPNDLDRST